LLTIHNLQLPFEECENGKYYHYYLQLTKISQFKKYYSNIPQKDSDRQYSMIMICSCTPCTYTSTKANYKLNYHKQLSAMPQKKYNKIPIKDL